MEKYDCIWPIDEVVETAMAMDRGYFEKNPEHRDYWRPALDGEHFGHFPPNTLCHVVNYGEGMRLRTFYLPSRH